MIDVVDDFVPEGYFDLIKHACLGFNQAWYYQPNITAGVFETKGLGKHGFNCWVVEQPNTFCDNYSAGLLTDLVLQMQNMTGCQNVLRSRLDMTFYTPGGRKCDPHIDSPNPHIATILSPLGGEFGFKGAALGGVAEIFSSILTGMLLSPEILPMMGPDFKTPRKMGAFVIVIDPNGFLGLEAVKLGMESYLSLLRKNKSLENKKILAPGDREWQEAQVRKLNGIPIDPETFDSYQLLAKKLNIKLPF